MSLGVGLRQVNYRPFDGAEIAIIEPDPDVIRLSDFTTISINDELLIVSISELIVVPINNEITVIEVCP